MSVGLFFPKLPSCTKTHQLTFHIYSLPIVVIYNQLDVGTYQQYIINKSSSQWTQRTQDVCTIFFLLRTTILGVYQQQLNRVQLYKSTISICKNQLTFSAPTEMRQQSSTDMNLSIGTQPINSVACVWMRLGSLQPACECVLAHYSPCVNAANV